MAPTLPEPSRTRTYDSISPSLPSVSCKGKTILITPCPSNLSSSIARSFAQAGAAHIVLLGSSILQLSKLAHALEHEFPALNAFPAWVDSAREKSVDEAFEAVAEKVGEVDVCVCLDAGGDDEEGNKVREEAGDKEIRNVDVVEWWAGFERDVKGDLVVAKAFLRTAVKEGAVLIRVVDGALEGKTTSRRSAVVTSREASRMLFKCVGEENPEVRVINIISAADVENERRAGEEEITADDEVRLTADFVVWAAAPDAGFLDGTSVSANWDVDELKGCADEIKNSDLLSM